MAENNLLYTCLKKSQKPKHMGLSCRWSGSIFDYAAHIREMHHESFFKLGRATALVWKLPLDDCFDKGLIQHKSQFYLYEMYFKRSEDNMYIALTACSDRKEHYRLSLPHKTLPDFCASQDCNDLHTLPSLTCEKLHIALPTSLLRTYSDPARNVKLKFLFKQQ